MKPYAIANWIPGLDTWEILEEFDSYDAADDRYDYWSETYENGWVEILSRSDLKNPPVIPE
jgi:hypothetical protein